MNDIKVSIITCLYNTVPSLFRQCLESIYNQTFKNFEVLIVNDGSTKYLEENKKIIESFNDNRFKYFDTEHTGKSQTLNFALNIARGKYVAICDSDDQMIDFRLEYQYNFLENNDYDLISNAMVTDDNHIIFPQVTESHEVKEGEVHTSVMHPSYMFNLNTVLKKVPFLFSQIYDSMEDAVFNQIMFHYGVKMWYDSNILQIYSHNNENSIHYENVNDIFKKYGTFKLNCRTFNYEYESEAKTTVILLINKKWGTDIEKTILNIRMTCNNVKILIIDYSIKNLDLSYLEKYNVSFIKLNDSEKYYNIALLHGINNCETKYYMIISKPLRFYTQDWDLIYERYLEVFPYYIIQPYITGFDKIDENNYINENGKIKDRNLRCGMQLNLFDKIISSNLHDLYFYSEYLSEANVPSINDDLIFFGITKHLKNIIFGLQLFDISTYIALYISVAISLCYYNVVINKDVKCGCIDNIDIMNCNNDKINYYNNMFTFICMFCNESKYIYEKIIYDAFDNKDIPKLIINDHVDNLNTFNDIKKSLDLKYDMSYFLKKNNLDKEWILTSSAY